MTTCFFWDWCPVSAVPWFSFTCNTLTHQTYENRFFQYGSSLPASVTYWIRTDGIFVFKLIISDELIAKIRENTPSLQGDPVADQKSQKDFQKEVVKIAKLVSDQIKATERIRSESHGMLLPDKLKDCATYGSISVTPRKVSDPDFPSQSTNDQIRDYLSDKRHLASLKGKQIGEKLDIPAPVSLLLRQQFNTCFEAAFITVRNIKYGYRVHMPGTQIVEGKRSLQLKSGKGFDVKSLPFFLLSYTLVFLIIFAAIFYGNFEVRDGSEFVVFLQNAKSASYYSLSSITFLFSALYLGVDVFSKRNPSIKAYSRAQEVLRSGNVYCTVVENIFAPVENAKAKEAKAKDVETDKTASKPFPDIKGRVEINGDFSNAIDVLEVWKSRERGKRQLAVGILGPICLLSGVPLFDVLSDSMPMLSALIEFVLSNFGLEMPNLKPSQIPDA